MTMKAVGPLPDQPPELRLADALRDLIGGALAEWQPPTPAPSLAVARAVPPQGRPEGRPCEMTMHVHLTERERGVINLVARGLGTGEIGSHVYLSERTVKNHVASVLAKLNACNRAHAVAIALRMGLIDPTLDELLGMEPTDKEGEKRP
jgi:DNA-binding NarL/FixJ family response regulator